MQSPKSCANNLSQAPPPPAKSTTTTQRENRLRERRVGA